MLLAWLQSQGAAVPQGDPDWGIWKHLPMPPTKENYIIPPNFRAVYLIGDPVDALLSVFRRGFHMWHAYRMQSKPLWPEGMQIANWPCQPSWQLQDFLDLDRDCFGMERQFDNWTRCPYELRGYPILCLKYEEMWKHVDTLLGFLGIPLTKSGMFPARRTRVANSGVTPADLKRITQLYENLKQKTENMPDFTII